MAYSVGKTSALQTAIKAGVDIAIAEFNAAVAAGDPTPSMLDRVNEVKDMLVVELFAQVDEDNAAIAAPSRNQGSRPQAPSNTSPRDAVVRFGQFKGLTLGDLVQMTKDEAGAYTGGKYKKDGLSYVKWMAANTDENAKESSAQAKAVLSEFNEQTRTLAALAGV